MAFSSGNVYGMVPVSGGGSVESDPLRPDGEYAMTAAVFQTERIATTMTTVSRRVDAKRWIAGLHDELTSFFGRLDKGGTFSEDRWERPGGGGGVARVMSDGVTFTGATR